MPEPLNVLYLHTHDLGRYCQPYGYAFPSPGLQRLAEQGVLFRQAFAAAPTCSPSRAALLTGQYPHRCGMLGLASERVGYTLNDYGRHLAALLRRCGYATALAGVHHVARLPWHDPYDMGYEELLNHDAMGLHDESDPRATVDAAVAFLRRRHDRPFFLSVGFFEPHRNNSAPGRKVFTKDFSEEPADLDERYCGALPWLPDAAVTRRESANFRQGVAILDRKMGAVLRALDERGLDRSTLVVCTTDHGPGFCDAKATLKDRGIGVALILRGPAFRAGQVVDAMVSQLDVYPTLCDLLDIPHPDGLDGKSLLPLLSGRADSLHDVLFAEQTYHVNYRPLRAVRTDRWKYIRRFDLDQPKGVDRGPAEQLLIEHGWLDVAQPAEELYDLVFDPHETCNLVGRPAYREALAGMQRRLDDWMERTGDPLCGEAPPVAPAGADPSWRERLADLRRRRLARGSDAADAR
jgi:arylsulfatase A-like enzyme